MIFVTGVPSGVNKRGVHLSVLSLELSKAQNDVSTTDMEIMPAAPVCDLLDNEYVRHPTLGASYCTFQDQNGGRVVVELYCNT